MKHQYIQASLLALTLGTLAACTAPTLQDWDDKYASEDLVTSHRVQEMVEEEPELTSDDPRLYCERRMKTGSHMVRRRCVTAQEAETSEKRNRQIADRWHRQNKSRSESVGPNGLPGGG